ncbi:MAG TPA: methyltransferase [Mucilaginibacter sp.]|nr:methyltransferase [Mucilaginibacter sp.]
MPDIFRFKQFDVDQSGCAMKINTDGVLLGALTEVDQPKNILDIGTGTGVIALMLAQRFSGAKIDAVEIDATAAQTAGGNFTSSPFAERLQLYPTGFEQFFVENPGKKYDLIVSNPPFFINSLKSPEAKKELAKHTDEDFFRKLIKTISAHLNAEGRCWLIIPLTIADFIFYLAAENNLCLQKRINVKSFEDSLPHRVIACFGSEKISTEISKLVIYEAVGVYSEEYIKLLKPYFIAF